MRARGGADPLAWRIRLLDDEPRLARCLSTAASLGGWEGGGANSGQGVAAHGFRDSYVAVMAETHRDDAGRPIVDRLVAAVDCGRVVNPDIVRQQIEGGLIFGLAALRGGAVGFEQGYATPSRLGALNLPRLADTPDITVELIRSDEEPGGVGELAVPPVAPAIANALATLPASHGYEACRWSCPPDAAPDHPPVPRPKIGVLLMNLGTPDAPDPKSVKRYLREFLSEAA